MAGGRHGSRCLANWLRDEGAQAADEVCFSPEAPDARCFRLSLERGGTDDGALGAADTAMADLALDILREAGTVVTPRTLMGRLAGRTALGAGAGVRLPVFVLGRDARRCAAPHLAPLAPRRRRIPCPQPPRMARRRSRRPGGLAVPPEPL